MISVLNLFMLSVFWGFLLEIFAQEQTKRLFGVIAAGGSAGALVGPWLTTATVTHIGNSGILYLGASLFMVAIVCQRALLTVWHHARQNQALEVGHDEPVGGKPLIDGPSGMGLAAVGSFAMLAFVFCARRIGEYAFVRPGREMLFSALSTQDRYRVKHVIDVPVYRGGDALSSQVDSFLGHAGLSPAKVAVVGSGLAALWLLNAWWLGQRHDKEEVTSSAAQGVRTAAASDHS
jgi:ATP/ADP translocase